MQNNKIFISHSSKDEPVVTAFIDKILNGGLGIKREDIFYTSGKDTGPKSGDDFRKAIKDKLIGAVAVIQIISRNYKESEVCLNEMGAAWVLSNKVIPFILEPIHYDNVGFIHNTTQLLKLNDAEDLYKFQDDHPDLYEDRRINQTNYHRQVNEFIKLLSGGNYRFGMMNY